MMYFQPEKQEDYDTLKQQLLDAEDRVSAWWYPDIRTLHWLFTKSQACIIFVLFFNSLFVVTLNKLFSHLNISKYKPESILV